MPTAPEPPIRDAATVILMRRTPRGPQVLMGQRGAGAVFMPDKFVFPGGAVDPEDLALPAGPVDGDTARRLAVDATADVARALPLAAVRELWEETGLMLGRPDPGAAAAEVPATWRGFFAAGLVPHTAALRLVFRAVTPPQRPRRFDARFFLADADALPGGHDDFTGAGGELALLQWLDLADARALPLPFVTEVVLMELGARLADPHPAARPVPYFRHLAEGSHVRML